MIIEVVPKGKGDLLVRVVEMVQHSVEIDKELTMRVSKEVLIANSHCMGNQPSYFKTMFTGLFKESSSDEITLEEDTIASMELWFRVFHGVKAPDASYKLPINELWEIIAAAEKYGFDVTMLVDWFQRYWNRVARSKLTFKQMRQLLFPCQTFHHVNAFAYLTKRISFEAGEGMSIFELNPTRHKHLHLEGRVIQQLNGAKGTITKQIKDGLLCITKPSTFCELKCKAQKDSLWAYMSALEDTGIWRLTTGAHIGTYISNKEILESVGWENWNCQVPNGACRYCKDRLNAKRVKDLRKKIQNYWQGICLDCMHLSEDYDEDCQEHLERREGPEPRKIWHKNTEHQMQHERNSHYHSVMARPQETSVFMKETKLKIQQKIKDVREAGALSQLEQDMEQSLRF